jgi:hypothetical protein
MNRIREMEVDNMKHQESEKKVYEMEKKRKCNRWKRKGTKKGKNFPVHDKAFWRSRVIAPVILIIDGDEWSYSRFGHFTSEKEPWCQTGWTVRETLLYRETTSTAGIRTLDLSDHSLVFILTTSSQLHRRGIRGH